MSLAFQGIWQNLFSDIARHLLQENFVHDARTFPISPQGKQAFSFLRKNTSEPESCTEATISQSNCFLQNQDICEKRNFLFLICIFHLQNLECALQQFQGMPFLQQPIDKERNSIVMANPCQNTAHTRHSRSTENCDRKLQGVVLVCKNALLRVCNGASHSAAPCKKPTESGFLPSGANAVFGFQNTAIPESQMQGLVCRMQKKTIQVAAAFPC